MADTITVRRCMTCNVVLPDPVHVPAGVLLACGTCKQLLRQWEENIEYRDNRNCKCGHTLDDHDYIDGLGSAAPSPCKAYELYEEECDCGNFQEADH